MKILWSPLAIERMKEMEIRLEPVNHDYDSIVLRDIEEASFQVIGRFVGIITHPQEDS